MNDPIEDMKALWQKARNTDQKQFPDTDRIIMLAKQKRKSIIRMHVGNILILLMTLLLISSYFMIVSFNQVLSHIGIGLMVCGLLVRILIELWSIALSAKIDLSDDTLKTNENFLKFYQFRKRIHGPVTITIVALYTMGFYLLTPEFSSYFNTPMMVLIDGSYLVGACIFTWFIHKAIRKEMNCLNEMISIRKDIVQVPS